MAKTKIYAISVILLVWFLCLTKNVVAQNSAIENGIQWLRDNQIDTGPWGNESYLPSTLFIDSCVVLNTLRMLGQTGITEYNNGLQWIGDQEVASVDSLSRKIEVLSTAGVNVSDSISALVSYQHRDGGWGGYSGYESNVLLDTVLALRSLTAAGYPDNTVIEWGLSYLLANQNPDGGFGIAGNNSLGDESMKDSNIYVTALAMLVLSDYRGIYNVEGAIGNGANWLAGRQNENGSFGGSVWETAWSYLALIRAQSTDDRAQILIEALGYLRDQQQLDDPTDAGYGSWNQNAYETALALRALKGAGPDLTLSSRDISFSPAMPTDGSEAAITVVVHNYGGTAVEDVVVRVSSGAWQATGAIASIGVGGIASIEIGGWAAAYGEHEFTVEIDPGDSITETDEGNNTASRSVTVASRPDLVISAADILFFPDSPRRGEILNISASVSNLGETEVSNVGCSVNVTCDNPLVGPVQDYFEIPAIAAGGNIQVLSLDYWVTLPGNYTVLVEIDPNQNIAETNETNNTAQRSFAVASIDGIDLVVASLDIDPEFPRPEKEVTITATIMNQGGDAAGQFKVGFQVDGQKVETQTIPSLAGNSSQELTFNWTTPRQEGTYTVKIVVDSDSSVAEVDEANNAWEREVAVAALAVKVLSPNNGQVWSGVKKIYWDILNQGDETLSFDLYLSSNSGESYDTVLASDLSHDTRSWRWDTTSDTIPVPDGDDYRIKVMTTAYNGADTETVEDESDLSFTIDNTSSGIITTFADESAETEVDFFGGLDQEGGYLKIPEGRWIKDAWLDLTGNKSGWSRGTEVINVGRYGGAGRLILYQDNLYAFGRYHEWRPFKYNVYNGERWSGEEEVPFDFAAEGIERVHGYPQIIVYNDKMYLAYEARQDYTFPDGRQKRIENLYVKTYDGNSWSDPVKISNSEAILEELLEDPDYSEVIAMDEACWPGGPYIYDIGMGGIGFSMTIYNNNLNISWCTAYDIPNDSGGYTCETLLHPSCPVPSYRCYRYFRTAIRNFDGQNWSDIEEIRGHTRGYARNPSLTVYNDHLYLGWTQMHCNSRGYLVDRIVLKRYDPPTWTEVDVPMYDCNDDGDTDDETYLYLHFYQYKDKLRLFWWEGAYSYKWYYGDFDENTWDEVIGPIYSSNKWYKEPSVFYHDFTYQDELRSLMVEDERVIVERNEGDWLEVGIPPISVETQIAAQSYGFPQTMNWLIYQGRLFKSEYKDNKYGSDYIVVKDYTDASHLPSLALSNDGSVAWSYPGKFETTRGVNLADTLNAYLANHQGEAQDGFIQVPLRLHSESVGYLTISNINIRLGPAEPDLAVFPEDILFSDSRPVAGNQITIQATVHNLGGEDVSGVVVRFFDGEPGGGGFEIGNALVAVAAKATAAAEVTWTASPVGWHMIYVVVDPAAPETDETNNQAGMDIVVNEEAITGPDLRIRAEDISFNPASPIECQPVTIRANVYNQGNMKANNVKVAFYDGETFIDGGVISEISSGDTRSVEITWDPMGQAGRNYIHVKVDPNYDIVETNELNNKALQSVDVIVPDSPDLRVTEISYQPANPMEGDEVAITAVVRNCGPEVAEARVEFEAGGTALGSGKVYHLGAGESGEMEITWDTSGQEGSYQIQAVVDPINDIKELDETNNSASTGITITSAQLSLEVNASTASCGANETMSISVDLTNHAEQSRSLTLEVRIEDQAGNEVTVVSEEVISIEAGTSESRDLIWNTGHTYSGDYRIQAKALEGGKVRKSAAFNFSISPDLSLDTRLTTDKIAYGANETVTITSVVTSTSANFTYIDLLIEVELGGKEIGTVTISQLLPGARKEHKFYWDTLTNPEGGYQVNAVYSNAQITSQDTASFIIRPCYDLPGEITVLPREVESPNTFSLNYRLTNNGNVDIMGMTLRKLVIDPVEEAIARNISELVALDMGDSHSNSVVVSSSGLSSRNYLEGV